MKLLLKETSQPLLWLLAFVALIFAVYKLKSEALPRLQKIWDRRRFASPE